MARCLGLADEQHYVVSDFEPNRFSADPAFVYAAAVRGENGEVLGGVAVVWDAAAQLRSILDDVFSGCGPRDALAFVDALGLTEVDLFGFSIGGFVAQEVALQRPHLVRRMILAGTGPQGGREMHGWIDEARAHAMKDVQGEEDVLYLFFSPSQESQNKGKEFVGRIFTRTEGRDTTPDLAARDAQAAAIIEWGIRDVAKLARLANIQAPTLVANGDNDVMVPTVNSYLLAGHLPNATLSIYPDANHGFLFQYPHEFAGEVNAFLAASARGSR